MTKKLTITATVLVAVAGGVILWDRWKGDAVRWQGAIPLLVTLENAAPHAITDIQYAVVPDEESARYMLRWHGQFRLEHELKCVAHAAKPFLVEVPSGGSWSTLGRELRYGHWRYLALFVKWENGRVEGKATELPADRHTRQVTIRVPAAH